MVYVGTNGWDFRVNISHSCRPANAPPAHRIGNVRISDSLPNENA